MKRKHEESIDFITLLNQYLSTIFYEQDVIKELDNLISSVDINAKDKNGLSAFYHCIIADFSLEPFYDVADYLIENGANVNETYWDGNNILHYAILKYRGDYDEDFKFTFEAFQYLIDKGVDVNATNNKGVSPLQLAVDEGQEEIVQLLLANGAKVDIPNMKGITPLSLSTQLIEPAIHKLCIKNVPNIN